MNNRPEPKFVPGERVVIASPTDPELSGVVTVVTDATFECGHDLLTGRNAADWQYHCEVMPNSGDHWLSYDLRKLPPETHATFDAAIWQPNREGVKA